jgi:hypothetical protein
MTRNVVISLFDYTGNAVQPWREAGYDCIIVDIQHACGTTLVPRGEGEPESWGRLYKVRADLTQPFDCRVDCGVSPDRVAFVFAFPPCDHLAVSGARWFAGKGLRLLAWSISLFATAAEFCDEMGVPYLIENPVSTISTYWRKADHFFDPCDYTAYHLEDNYVKKTCLWTGGGFVMPPANRAANLGEPDDRIHKCPPGPNRKNIRSATAMGFSRAVFEANHVPQRTRTRVRERSRAA